MEVTQNLTELMFDPHAIFVIRECFCLVTRYGADDKPEFSNAVCETILEQWESLVLGRKSTFSYKMAMWVIIADRRVGRFESSLRTFLLTLETKMFFFIVDDFVPARQPDNQMTSSGPKKFMCS